MERDLKQLVALAESSGFGFIVDKWGLDDADWDSLEDINSNKFQSILDLWGVHKQFRTEYNDFIENQNASYPSGGQAANNYANRNKREYVYRRETTAPYFADALKRQFPGVEIGALGYIRDVNDVGGARAVNSDHQSGGAIDVYWKRGTTAEKNAKMAEINAWLRRQGGVSFTNWYDGKSHVHVSFLLGWRIPSRA